MFLKEIIVFIVLKCIHNFSLKIHDLILKEITATVHDM